MKRFRRFALFFLVILFLTSLVLAADGCAPATETLEGKNLLLQGDSYSAHHKLSFEEGWPYLVAEDFGMTLYDYAVSGSSFAGGDKGRNPMVDRYTEVADVDYDIILLQGGSNDWSHNIPLGDIDSRDETTMLGAMNVIMDYYESLWPDATVICFTPWISTGATNALGLETTDYAEAIQDLCQARGALCYDATNAAVNGIYMNKESFRSKYCLSSTDRWHLNAAGQKLFASVFSRWLSANLLGITTADRFSDMTTATQELRSAVSLVYEKGIMYGMSDTLFSPSQAATRTTLAVTLYRMAGSPAVTSLNFTDVASDNSAYNAICWAVGKGLMEAENSTFSPDDLLHRDEMVWAMYSYFTDICGGEVMRLTGLGQFPDKDSVTAGHETAWGWALSQEILSAQGKLQPVGLVSRGQLAIALSNLIQAA